MMLPLLMVSSEKYKDDLTPEEKKNILVSDWIYDNMKDVYFGMTGTAVKSSVETHKSFGYKRLDSRMDMLKRNLIVPVKDLRNV